MLLFLSLLSVIQRDPENLYNELTPAQIDVLVGSLNQDQLR